MHQSLYQHTKYSSETVQEYLGCIKPSNSMNMLVNQVYQYIGTKKPAPKHWFLYYLLRPSQTKPSVFSHETRLKLNNTYHKLTI